MILLFLYRHKNLRTSLFWIFWGKKLLPAWFSVKFVMLPERSSKLANWFACMPACMSAIMQVSLTSLTKVSLAPLGYIMVVYFDSTALFQQFLENILIWSRFSRVKSTLIKYFLVSFPFPLCFFNFSCFVQLVNK